jgi:hypothetical protein
VLKDLSVEQKLLPSITTDVFIYLGSVPGEAVLCLGLRSTQLDSNHQPWQTFILAMLFSSVSLLARFLALATFSSAQTTTSSTSVCPSIVSDIPILTTLSLTAEPTRTFYQFLPPAYTGGPSQSALPVILSFHRASRNATEQAGLDRFWDPVFQGSTPYIVIYAEAHKVSSSR